MAMVHMAQQHWPEADRYYAEAFDHTSRSGDSAAARMIDVNRVEMWILRGDIPKAASLAEKALRSATVAGDHRAKDEMAKHLGTIARTRGNFPESERRLEAAMDGAMKRQDLLLAAETARERAELHRRRGENAQMLRCLNEAHTLFGRLRARRDLADVDRRTGRLEAEFLEVVGRWGASIESKDRYTQGHCERVADMACQLAQRVGLDARSLFWFRVGALLHDVGKLDIPAEILNKPGRLTPHEWALMRAHPEAGIALLSDIEFPWDIRPLVLSHHERWDGNGYPHGLAGEAIPFTARILTIADVYDALTSERSYKPAVTHAEAMRIMRDDAGAQFDPVLFAAFEALFPADMTAPPAPRRLA
jgi:putative nucleotidyltransferase with HDIG domain